jgi:G:T/U-mismatch repair DNA glycosylase
MGSGQQSSPAPDGLELEDVVVERPRLLLVGINPGRRSGAVGHHFAGNGNPFWRLLAAARLTPVLLHYSDDHRLAEFGIALTNLCPRTTRTAAELTRAEIVRGRAALARKIARWKPAVVAFVGVSLYAMYFGRGAGGGPGPKPEIIAWTKGGSAARSPSRGGLGTLSGSRSKIAGARVFVVPNPSGLNASYPGFAHKLVWFKKLRAFLGKS